MKLLLSLFALAGFAAFAYRRGLRYLHIFQQEEYDGSRFLHWLVRAAAFDKRLSAVIVAIALLGWLAPGWITTSLSLSLAALGLAFLAAAYFEPDPRQQAKKKLAMTQRATRIFGIALAAMAAGALLALWSGLPLGWLIMVQAIPVLIVLANLALSPYEHRIQQKFRQEAVDKLQEVAPTVIGITGSFGKTSVKHVLGHILELNSRALFTPGSVNTVMGISRVIRERLEKGCQFFVVEMGAYGQGSIKRLCDFTPPDHGLITSIGEAHYERFKSLDSVARAKFELAEAVLRGGDGKMIVDQAVMAQPHAAGVIAANRDRFVVVGEDAKSDAVIKHLQQTRDGIALRLDFDGASHELFAPLFGQHHGRNMALAFATAVTLGIPADRAVAALRSVPQIKHRLEVKGLKSGPVYIDDAYNSNPDGFAGALKLMQILRQSGGNRILVTPGMAELGDKHDMAHAAIGREAAGKVDVALVIRPDRIPSFVQAFAEGEGEANGKLLTFETFDQARTWLNTNTSPKDVILIENDLPDLLERPFSA